MVGVAIPASGQVTNEPRGRTRGRIFVYISKRGVITIIYGINVIPVAVDTRM
jgi:hypothetical protein